MSTTRTTSLTTHHRIGRLLAVLGLGFAAAVASPQLVWAADGPSFEGHGPGPTTVPEPEVNPDLGPMTADLTPPTTPPETIPPQPPDPEVNPDLGPMTGDLTPPTTPPDTIPPDGDPEPEVDPEVNPDLGPMTDDVVTPTTPPDTIPPDGDPGPDGPDDGPGGFLPTTGGDALRLVLVGGGLAGAGLLTVLAAHRRRATT